MDPQHKKSEFWDKTFKTVESTPVQPVARQSKIVRYNQTVDAQVDILKNLDPFLYKQYNKGKLMSRNRNLDNDEYTEVLYVVIKCIFQGIRDDIHDKIESVEERQEQLCKISAAENIFIAGLDVLKTMKIKLDVNLIITIIYGYIGDTVRQIATSYEDRKST
jgi:hypothetical protein